MPVITQRTFMAKKETARPDWYVLDADGQIVGRLATQIATVLMGKHKPTYTPHVVTGDVVIVLNAHQVAFSGKPMKHPTHKHFTTKMHFRKYDRYTGYPGGLRTTTAAQMLDKHPEMILKEAVRRMLPKTRLGRQMLANLRLICGPTHNHQAQQPKPFPAVLMPQ